MDPAGLHPNTRIKNKNKKPGTIPFLQEITYQPKRKKEKKRKEKKRKEKKRKGKKKR
jgi:hypothetical protein